MAVEQEQIRPDDQYYILATAAPVHERSLVLMQGNSFAVFDRAGDIDSSTRHAEGLYYRGTRFLSGFSLKLAGARPLLLSSTVRWDNVVLAADLTNPDVYFNGVVVLPRGAVHIFRTKFLFEGVHYERIRVRNFGSSPADFKLDMEFQADFLDIFEVRGSARPNRGTMLPSRTLDDRVELAYRGLDNIIRTTEISSGEGIRIVGSSLVLNACLDSHGECSYQVRVACRLDDARVQVSGYEEALSKAAGALGSHRQMQAGIESSNEHFNQFVDRCTADLNMMLSPTDEGAYPYAGVPWFSTPFGRDGIITALECLWMAPEVARGVLRFLAGKQATSIDPVRDAEPGKILHEMRDGEMANLGEVPFSCYYGSIDSTPLFVMLAGAYYRRTGDIELIRAIWPNIVNALRWVNEFGDFDGDGFVEYARRATTGLVQQGWKDSHDSVFHADGSMADAPIALCEVQGYVYAALRAAADLADALGHNAEAARARRQSEGLRTQFEEAFWDQELGTYVLALDAAKRPCRVRSSNAGHCLLTGIASPERAQRVIEQLTGDSFYTGWGIRTLATGEVRYNPMSYHNGSVWPHDNAMIAAGFARYQAKDHAARILTSMFEVSTFMDLMRLPELFCGFSRRPGKAPTSYPVACSPQAWASAAIFLLIQSCLGLEIDAPNSRVTLSRPVLPSILKRVRISNLAIGDGSVDLELFQHGSSVAVTAYNRRGNIEVATLQ